MATAAILVFQKIEILTVEPLQEANMRHCTKSYQNGQRVAEIWRFNVFSKWRPSAILDLLGAYWTTHDDLLMVSVAVQNLVEIDAVNTIT